MALVRAALLLAACLMPTTTVYNACQLWDQGSEGLSRSAALVFVATSLVQFYIIALLPLSALGCVAESVVLATIAALDLVPFYFLVQSARRSTAMGTVVGTGLGWQFAENCAKTLPTGAALVSAKEFDPAVFLVAVEANVRLLDKIATAALLWVLAEDARRPAPRPAILARGLLGARSLTIAAAAAVEKCHEGWGSAGRAAAAAAAAAAAYGLAARSLAKGMPRWTAG